MYLTFFSKLGTKYIAKCQTKVLLLFQPSCRMKVPRVQHLLVENPVRQVRNCLPCQQQAQDNHEGVQGAVGQEGEGVGGGGGGGAARVGGGEEGLDQGGRPCHVAAGRSSEVSRHGVYHNVFFIRIIYEEL